MLSIEKLDLERFMKNCSQILTFFIKEEFMEKVDVGTVNKTKNMARIVNIIVRVTKTHKAPLKIELKKVEKHSKILRVVSWVIYYFGLYAD